MAKAQTFADKLAKAQQMKGAICPVCNQILQPLLVVRPERSVKGGTRLRHERVKVCKCNEKAIYG